MSDHAIETYVLIPTLIKNRLRRCFKTELAYWKLLFWFFHYYAFHFWFFDDYGYKNHKRFKPLLNKAFKQLTKAKIPWYGWSYHTPTEYQRIRPCLICTQTRALMLSALVYRFVLSLTRPQAQFCMHSTFAVIEITELISMMLVIVLVLAWMRHFYFMKLIQSQ